MSRAIIRYSFDGDDGKTIRMDIGKRLLERGRFIRSGTASWESRSDLPLSEAVDAIRWALEVVEESDPDALDHIWIYIDNGTVETDQGGN
ncbi:MAG: hypothetical protein WAU42_08910 [Solirubrobacteraceae bacterium]